MLLDDCADALTPVGAASADSLPSPPPPHPAASTVPIHISITLIIFIAHVFFFICFLLKTIKT
jgi:hypothetical protein